MEKNIEGKLFQSYVIPNVQALAGLEYLLKNGPPRVQQALLGDKYKITTLQNFTYYEDNADKGLPIREKAILITDLLNYPARLEEERQQAAQYR